MFYLFRERGYFEQLYHELFLQQMLWESISLCLQKLENSETKALF